MSLALAAQASVTLVAGRSGSGKSTFAIRYLLNARDVACRFVFDPRDEYAQRLRLAPARTPVELEVAIRRGWLLFDGSALFPGDVSEAFAFWSDLVWEFSVAIPGRKIAVVDEVWKYCSPQSIPHGLAQIVQDGRKSQLESVFLTQRPNRLNESILGEVTECVCFPMSGERGLLKMVNTCDVPEAEVAALVNGQFVSVSDRGGILRGRVF